MEITLGSLVFFWASVLCALFAHNVYVTWVFGDRDVHTQVRFLHWNPTIRQSPTWRNPTIAEPDRGSKLRLGPELQHPTVHLDPIWQHTARAHDAEPDPGATLHNPTRAYSAEPDITNCDPSPQPASQSQSQPASRSSLILAPASYQAASQPRRGGSLAACHGSRLFLVTAVMAVPCRSRVGAWGWGRRLCGGCECGDQIAVAPCAM